MKFMVVGDIHLSDKPPSIRTDGYTDQILAKLQFAVDVAVERNCRAIVLAGDVFHVKTPSRTSHALVQKVGELLSTSGKLVLIVPGNHDMQHDRIESLDKQPLGTLAMLPGIDLLMGPYGDLPIFGIPYLSDWSTLPEYTKRYQDWAGIHKAEDMAWVPLVVTHAPIFPPGEEPPYEFLAAEDVAELVMAGDIYYGHIHDPHGAYTTPGWPAVQFCNQGAISRGSLHEATLKRRPAVTIWDDEKEQSQRFERVELPHLPADEVFRLAEKEDVDVRQERVGAFLAGIEQTVLTSVSLEQVLDHAQRMGLRPRTLSELRSVVEEVASR